MKYYYRSTITDYWVGMLTTEEMAQKIGKHCKETTSEAYDPGFDDPEAPQTNYLEYYKRYFAHMMNILDSAKTVWKLGGWDGDIVDGPYWAALPNINGDNGTFLMVAIKQRDDGRCFLASEVDIKLPDTFEINALSTSTN